MGRIFAVVLCSIMIIGAFGAAQCSHNGVLNDAGACVCDRGWKGNNCSMFNLGKMDLTKRQGGFIQPGTGTTTWGAAVVHDPQDGKYHMWASEYVNQCFEWTTNSAVVHATSDSAEGPYVKTGTVLGAFSHEGNVQRAGTGEYVMFFTAHVDDNGNVYAQNKWGQPTTPCDCSQGKTCTKAPDGSQAPTYMIYTDDPNDDNSWSSPLFIIDPLEEDSIDTNMDALIDANGGAVGLWRHYGDCVGDLENVCSRIYSFTATNYKDASTYSFSHTNLFPGYELSRGIEDPFLYRDTRGMYHATFHTMLDEIDNILHAYSEDGISWTDTGYALVLNADNGVQFETTEGHTVNFYCERPHLVISPSGELEALTIGGALAGVDDDLSLVQALGLDQLDKYVDKVDTLGTTWIIPFEPSDIILSEPEDNADSDSKCTGLDNNTCTANGCTWLRSNNTCTSQVECKTMNKNYKDCKANKHYCKWRKNKKKCKNKY